MGFSAKVFETWEVAAAQLAGGQILIAFDRNKPTQSAYVCDPRTAREIGRALISMARKAEQAQSRTKT